jgi:hypothetical protein
MTQFVLGFLFTPDAREVVLVRKKRPESLAGKLNGVGGRLGAGESARLGVSREFFEATGVAVPPQDWRPVARLWGRGYEIAGFCATSEAAARCQNTGDEDIRLLPVRYDMLQAQGALGLSWVIAAALDPRKPILDIRVRAEDPDWAD